MTDLHEPLDPLDSCPDELPPPRQHGDVNLVGLRSVAGDLTRSLSTLKIRVQPYDPKTAIVSPEKARENLKTEIDHLLGKAVYLPCQAHAAMLGRCVLGADSQQDCSIEGAHLQLNVWDAHTRRDTRSPGRPPPPRGNDGAATTATQPTSTFPPPWTTRHATKSATTSPGPSTPEAGPSRPAAPATPTSKPLPASHPTPHAPGTPAATTRSPSWAGD
ncbi:hypothetical protein ACFVZD_41350 [Streptomyces sp. NPDC058287]|uniref:hypothetical protein n=1 Tax=Streptomyces sp. NPDC058287 TaxID=3346423 RepID=UPI0036E148B1